MGVVAQWLFRDHGKQRNKCIGVQQCETKINSKRGVTGFLSAEVDTRNKTKSFVKVGPDPARMKRRIWLLLTTGKPPNLQNYYYCLKNIFVGFTTPCNPFTRYFNWNYHFSTIALHAHCSLFPLIRKWTKNAMTEQNTKQCSTNVTNTYTR